MTKANKILIIVLVVQAALAAITWTAVKDTPEVTKKSKLLNFEAKDVNKIEIVATQGEKVTPAIVLEKTGDAWTMASADGYPVKTETITELLDSLVGIEIESPIATTAANHSKLNVAKEGFDRKVTLTAGGKSVTLFLGRGARSDAHVRVAGSDDVYTAVGLSVWSINSRPTNYVETEYLKADADKAKSITITNAKGSIHFVKEGDAWTIPGLLPDDGADTSAAPVVAEGDTDGETRKEIDSAEIKRLADKLMAINLVEPVGKKDDVKYGLKDGATVVIESEKDGKPVTLKYAVGAKDETNRYLKADGNDYIVKVSNFIVEPVTEKVATDFIKEVKPGDEAPSEPPGGMGGMQGMPPGMMMP
ncbi:MAG: DUF4340 domain-containing protein, partial [Deltaproteobacteria bacterium]|nr:DUF4340 domain-containing protein [Deltaproteobacteria bacterium]MBN2674229.1 DUF4340 domain-containing protein [Deltaproteobacteria bacterium]